MSSTCLIIQLFLKSVQFSGFNFEFSKFLDPAVQGYRGIFDKIEGFWIFNLTGFISIIRASSESLFFTGSEHDLSLPKGAKRLKVLPSYESDFSQPIDLDTSATSSTLELDLSLGAEASSASSPPPSSESLAGPSPFSGGTATVHQQPDWLRQLKRNFNKEVVAVCSSRTREAVENNEYIQVVMHALMISNKTCYLLPGWS